ncbi:hypothetical protein [Paractinoplanes rishiriensis]|uniref:Fibronectin type-III domain-containing protein n=1 Tax=Paractinoplanes rishiriensis TaxID=1050105 RepID=A0A919JQ30_9ACTN|nr:hypothetical protein [Actinoplanes rishiriensis]GIE92805.1 hypothetical protein Ari01nite_02700 [Actinoplanes rishiriensis]
MRRQWLATLLLTPLLLSGCGKDGGAPGADEADEATGDSWVLVDQGKATAAPGDASNFKPRAGYPTGYLPLPTTSPAPTPTGTGGCPPVGEIVMNAASVEPGTTSAAVTFYNPGGTGLVQYRITAISQDLQLGDQRDVGWTVLTPGTGCGYLTGTVTGLDPATDYVFSVDAVFTQHDRDGTRSSTVARSGVVRTN